MISTSTIGLKRSIIPACDLDSLELFEKLVRETAPLEKIGAYKLGFELGLRFGLPRLVEIVRSKCKCAKPLIYDHQKAGTDIPDTGVKFAQTLKSCGIDAVIFFPQAGPVTERAWIEASLTAGLKVIVGGLMTHKGYVRSDGGYLADEAILEMYLTAQRAGVTEFVVPGNKPAEVRKIRAALEAEGAKPVFYAPGFVAQGGSISEAAQAAGECWHAIVGRGIYETPDIRKAAEELCRAL